MNEREALGWCSFALEWKSFFDLDMSDSRRSLLDNLDIGLII